MVCWTTHSHTVCLYATSVFSFYKHNRFNKWNISAFFNKWNISLSSKIKSIKSIFLWRLGFNHQFLLLCKTHRHKNIRYDTITAGLFLENFNQAEQLFHLNQLEWCKKWFAGQICPTDRHFGFLSRVSDVLSIITCCLFLFKVRKLDLI